MRFGPFGVPELLIIMLIIMLLFGAKRIPEISEAFGKGLRLFKKGATDEANEA